MYHAKYRKIPLAILSKPTSTIMRNTGIFAHLYGAEIKETAMKPWYNNYLHY